MEKIFLAISIKEKKTKIAVFQIDKNNDIFINEAHIINSFMSKSKPQKHIKKILKNFTIYQTVISIYNDCSKDYKKALFWYEKASLQEDSLAQFYVGQIYLLALGVKKDIEKAKIMFEKSCENGYEKSCLERDKLD